MPTTRTGSQSDEEGSTHLIECTGKGPDKWKGCQSWVPTWLPKKIHKGFMDRPFLCGFCAAAEVADLQSKLAKIAEKPQISGELSSLFNADSNQQYGRRDNVRIFGVEEAPYEDVYQAVIDVAERRDVRYPERTSASAIGFPAEMWSLAKGALSLQNL